MRTIRELMSLQGRRAVITGANGGIGQQMAATIADPGDVESLVLEKLAEKK